MIASAAITTATMMMIPMLMAAIIRPPLATISLRLACAKPRQGAGLELFTERLRDLTAKTYPRQLLIDCEEDRALRAVLVGMRRDADGRLKEAAEPTVTPPSGQPESRKPVLNSNYPW
jgi:hypothetical protein